MTERRGGYDDGYVDCSCFWGTNPGSFVQHLLTLTSVEGKIVLDVGCGEGKNAAYLADRGATVRAVDVSEAALRNAGTAFPPHSRLTYELADACDLHPLPSSIDIVIAYGLLHCLESLHEIETIVRELKLATRPGGHHVICAFNSRSQDLRAHPDFEPTLLAHSQLLSLYSDWRILASTDADLREVHPNNNIEHAHSITRLIAQRS